MKTNVCYQGDCLEVMKDIPDKSIDLIITSPPYDNLRTYNWFTNKIRISKYGKVFKRKK